MLTSAKGIVKKWLDALKSATFSSDTFDYFLKAFKSVLTSNMSTEALRSLALYITFAIHKPKGQPQQSLHPVKNMLEMRDGLGNPQRRQTFSAPSPSSKIMTLDLTKQLTLMQTALKVLEMYTDLLCIQNDTANIKKFARTVTKKVGPNIS